MQPITPHYTALGLLKVPDIVKLNTSLLLYNYFNADKRSNFNLSLVSKLHAYDSRSVSSNHLANTSFRHMSGNFVQQLSVGISETIFLNLLERNQLNKCFKKALPHYYLTQ